MRLTRKRPLRSSYAGSFVPSVCCPAEWFSIQPNTIPVCYFSTKSSRLTQKLPLGQHRLRPLYPKAVRSDKLVVEDVRSIKNKSLEAVTFDLEGKQGRATFAQSDLMAELRVQKRDLRVVDPSFVNQMAAFLVRPSAIFVNMEGLKAVVKHNRAMIFRHGDQLVDPDGETFFPSLSNSITHDSPDENPFEFRCVDAVLNHVCKVLDDDCYKLKTSINLLLEDLRGQKVELDENLEALMQLNKELNHFQKRTQEAHYALHSVLESDEDLAGMYLTVKALTGHPRRIDQHEGAEIMLENYLRQIQDIMNEVSELQDSIDVTAEHIKMTLDTQRNKIMRMSLLLTIGTFSTATGGVVTGIFGMNLTNFLESHPQAFAIATSCLLTGTFSSFVGVFLYCKLKKML